jgi:sarcosine oxidase subunit alpha
VRNPRQQARLAAGGLIDRGRRLAFTFDGRAYEGHPGDTLASALLANGVHLLGRSFKYHRPRGILTAGPEEPNALVALREGPRREPNTPATTAELYDGLKAASQNRWPSLRCDLLAVASLVAPLLPAGFYYKTFMWPAAFWERLYEPLIRRAAGLGRASGEPDPDVYERAFLHCDVLVVGAGPAGLMAALAAGRAGARVVLCEADFRLGGRLNAERVAIADRCAGAWVDAIGGELAALANVRILTRTTVLGAYDGGTFSALERVNDHVAMPPAYEPRQRLWRIFARRCVLAAGAIERPLVFADNDRPGVMLAAAVRCYLNRFAVAPGRRAVVCATNDETARTVADLLRAGVGVAAVIDPGARRSAEAAAKAAAAPLFAGGLLVRAHGRRRVAAVDVQTAEGGRQRIACDLVCASAGWSPTVHLACHLGARPVWDAAIAALVPADMPVGMAAAGAAAGRFGLGAALATGAAAGGDAAEGCGCRGRPLAVPPVAPEDVDAFPPLRVAGAQRKAFVDLQNDVTAADVALAQREGLRTAEHLKRYTTLGMATDQGKTSGLNGTALLDALNQAGAPPSVATTYRPPFVPVAIGALAGTARATEFRPTRLPPGHAWARQRGAVFVESGPWLRAECYPRVGEDGAAAVAREVRTVRGAVGVCDVSTLGKIDVQGADALAFLDRLYANSWARLAVGRVRYGVMLREDGCVLDDGTVARLAEDRFIVTTTTANAERVLQHMEFCQQWLWPELDVQLVSVAEHWAQFALAGPRSREVLEHIVDGRDVCNAAFPYLAAGEVAVMGGLAARLFRLSFSGELAYELAVPAGLAVAVLEAIMRAGEEFGIAPYGTEALSVMRIEKGHLSTSEITGQTTARDLGLAPLLARDKDYIGRVMAERPGLTAADRPGLVGVKPIDRRTRLRAGAHLVGEAAPAAIGNDQGYITAAVHSPTLGHAIGLGLLAGGARRHGERLRACDPVRGGDVLVEVCSPVFYDPAGERARG